MPAYPPGTVADTGFRPAQDGLPFENYGESLTSGAAPVDMTPEDVQKMFGGVVCADPLARTCDLIPEAEDWLNSVNEAMAGGHCYGFSVLADLLWQKKVAPATFGAPSVADLQLSDNAELQRQISYDWALQTLRSVQAQRIQGTPNRVLLTLITALKVGTSQDYTMVFWKRDGTGGHAVTPYAVVSKGGGMFDVMIYDNNHPGQPRAIAFDAVSDSWSYNASTNPSETASRYAGDAGTKTIALDPASAGLGTQPCPFCGKVPTAPTSGVAATNAEQVSLSGSLSNHANLVVSDGTGRKVGDLGGTFVDQIKGSSDEPVISGPDWTNTSEPIFNLPADRTYTLVLDGTHLTQPDDEVINVIGPSFDLAVKGIRIEPGERDTMVVEPDVTQVSYRSSRPESPTIDLGVSDTRADYSFEVGGVSSSPGSTINVTLPAEGGVLGVQPVGRTSPSSLSLRVTRESAQGRDSFQNGAVPLASGAVDRFEFGQWDGGGQPMPYLASRDGVATPLSAGNQPPA